MNIAFVKYGGLCSGGTERFLQTLSVTLKEHEFNVDYYYCDACPYLGSDYVHPTTDVTIKKYLEDNDVNLIKFSVEYKDVRTHTHEWVNTNFWDLFDENKYDVVITGRAGHQEYPYYKMNNVPLINILTLNAGVDNQNNNFRNIHLSNWSGQRWIESGGDPSRLDILGIIQKLPDIKTNFRKKYNLNKKFVYGFHQRDSEHISSTIPIEAYAKIESDDTAFIMMGGSNVHLKKAEELKLKNFYHIPHSGDVKIIHKFLNTIDVFSHGRKDGETFGAVFVEAMYHSKPCLSHTAESNGHIEVIGDCGKVVSENDVDTYAKEMLNLKNDPIYYKELSLKARNRYDTLYSYKININKFLNIIKDMRMIDNLRSLNVKAKNILDIGAHFGEFAKSINYLFPESYILMIEGNDRCESTLKDLPFDYCIALLSDTNKKVNFYMNKNNLTCTGCSYYKENTEGYDDAVVEKKETFTLDEVVSTTDKEFDFIKLDTQGSELDILKGGTDTLKKSNYVLIECSVIKEKLYNKGSYHVDDIIEFMKEKGFSTYYVVDEHAFAGTESKIYDFGEIFQRDYLFVSDNLK